MSHFETGSVLMVCVDVEDAPQTMQIAASDDSQQVAWSHASSGRAALELMRMLRFDLVVTAPRLPDMSVWNFVQAFRNAWPWQKWALVGESVSERDEIHARTQGVLRIYDAIPHADELLELSSSIRRQSAPAVMARAGSTKHAVGAGHPVHAIHATYRASPLRGAPPPAVMFEPKSRGAPP